MENPDPKWDIDTAVRVSDIEDEILNHNLETDILHTQGLMKHHTTLETWCMKYNVEY